MHFTDAGTVECAETLRTEDYNRCHLGLFDGAARHARREVVFPEDCRRACALGRSAAPPRGKRGRRGAKPRGACL